MRKGDSAPRFFNSCAWFYPQVTLPKLGRAVQEEDLNLDSSLSPELGSFDLQIVITFVITIPELSFFLYQRGFFSPLFL